MSEHYSKDTHKLELTKPAYSRVQQLFGAPVRVRGIPFVACVGEKPIYAGAFWSSLSSLSHHGVTIMQPFSTEEQTIQIQLGYASPVMHCESRDACRFRSQSRSSNHEGTRYSRKAKNVALFFK